MESPSGFQRYGRSKRLCWLLRVTSVVRNARKWSPCWLMPPKIWKPMVCFRLWSRKERRRKPKLFVENMRVEFCVFLIPNDGAYRAYGLARANLLQTFLSPRVWASNARLRREKGWRTELPPKGQDAMQMAGMFVIGTDGLIRLPYYYDDIADHPPLDLLLHGVMGVNWKKPLEKPLLPARARAKSGSKK